MSITKDKDPYIREKMHETFFLKLFSLYILSGCDLFNMFFLS